MINTVRGQYGAGEIDGKPVPAYRDEPNVSPKSNVETYAAVKLLIDNWRWAGVPFYLRSGKRLARRTTKIVVRFKTPPLSIFGSGEKDPVAPNYLIFHIQPEEGITFQVRAKVPGPTITAKPVHLDFDYGQFGERPRRPATKSFCMIVWWVIRPSFIGPIWFRRLGKRPNRSLMRGGIIRLRTFLTMRPELGVPQQPTN